MFIFLFILLILFLATSALVIIYFFSPDEKENRNVIDNADIEPTDDIDEEFIEYDELDNE